uniref:3-dehydrosphinganine reductase n=1 Tax=Panagrolaimus sp. JU765 TaxID=591449 RepID=A0AC34QUG6_9BILA
MEPLLVFLLAFLSFICCSFIAVVIFFVAVLPKRIPAKIPGSHVFITGGSKGIGKMIAEQMLLRRAKTVSIAARNMQDLKNAKEYLEKSCDDSQLINIYQLDVTSSYENIKSVIDKAVEDSGPIEILVNNAGYVIQGDFSEIPVSSFESQMKINYISGALVTRAVIDQMKEAKSGHICFVSSAAGQCAIWGYSAYSPSKFAVRGFAEALHMELLPYNIGVTVLYPPNTETEGFEVEQQTMPEEVRLIGESAGIFTAKEVAEALVNDMLKGEFITAVGLEGKMLGALTAGAGPEPSVINAVIQTFLGGIFRCVMLGYLSTFNRIVQMCHSKKTKK